MNSFIYLFIYFDHYTVTSRKKAPSQFLAKPLFPIVAFKLHGFLFSSFFFFPFFLISLKICFIFPHGIIWRGTHGPIREANKESKCPGRIPIHIWM